MKWTLALVLGFVCLGIGARSAIAYAFRAAPSPDSAAPAHH